MRKPPVYGAILTPAPEAVTSGARSPHPQRQFLATTDAGRRAWQNRRVARSGAFKDRPLWRRLQTIHHAIKERKFPNASSLASELAVSSKTVQRDLDYLRDELEAIVESDRL